MLRIYDEADWRRRRRWLLLATFGAGSLFGGLILNSTLAGSESVPLPRQVQGCEADVSGLRLACKLQLETRLSPR